MKRNLATALFLSMGMLLIAAPAALASQLKITQGPYQYSNGGEFNIVGVGSLLPAGHYVPGTTSNIGVPNSVQTFCIETTETLTFNTTYFYTISNTVKLGGVSPGGRDLTAGAAWLYRQFATGSLTDYNYANVGGTRANDAGLLQQAIWWAEGYAAYAGVNNKFTTDVKNALGAGNVAGVNTDMGVQVVNLWSGCDPSNPSCTNPTYNQDLLILLPEPGTLMLLGSGLAGLAYMAARRRRVTNS